MPSLSRADMPPAMADHWDNYHRYWALLGAPLRPPPEAVAALAREAIAEGGDVLLLGMTPDLLGLGRTTLIVDASPGMIAAFQPDPARGRRVIAGSWFALPAADKNADAVLGDGCLNALGSAAERRALLGQAARVLRPGGRAAIRLFAAPEEQETLAAVRRDALAGAIANFNAFKWRVAMALAGPKPDCGIAVTAIHDAVTAMFPDRGSLAAVTGWDPAAIDTIDAYRGSGAVYSFATAARTAAEAEDFFGEVRLVPSGTYPLAERCPVMVMAAPRPAVS